MKLIALYRELLTLRAFVARMAAVLEQAEKIIAIEEKKNQKRLAKW